MGSIITRRTPKDGVSAAWAVEMAAKAKVDSSVHRSRCAIDSVLAHRVRQTDASGERPSDDARGRLYKFCIQPHKFIWM